MTLVVFYDIVDGIFFVSLPFNLIILIDSLVGSNFSSLGLAFLSTCSSLVLMFFLFFCFVFFP